MQLLSVTAALLFSVLYPAAEFNELFQEDKLLKLYSPTSRVCGVVAVIVAAQRNGIATSAQEVADELPVGRHGSSMADIAEVLRDIGLDSLCVEIDVSALDSLLANTPSCSAVVHVDGNHWVYAEGTAAGGFRYFDYPDWRLSSVDEFKERFSGRAIIVADSPVAEIMKREYISSLTLRLTTTIAFGVVILVTIRSFHGACRT